MIASVLRGPRKNWVVKVKRHEDAVEEDNSEELTKEELEAKCCENEVEIIPRVCGRKTMRITKEYLLSLLKKSRFVTATS